MENEKTVVETTAVDTEETLLRNYMEKEFSGLNSNRSTASYALEFLKNQQDALKTLQKHRMAQMHVDSMVKAVEHLEDQLNRLKEELKNIEKLEAQKTS